MDSNERFGSIEAMLADLLRSVDKLTEKMEQMSGYVRSQGEQLGKLTRFAERQDGQIDDIIKILKMSDARHTKAEIRQDEALDAIRAQGKRLDEQGRQLDKQGKRLDEQGKRLEEQSRRADANTEGLKQLLQAQAQMMGLLTHTSNRTDKLTGQDEANEARFQRLEEAVFRKAS